MTSVQGPPVAPVSRSRSADGLATAHVPRARRGVSAGQVRADLAGQAFDSLTDVAVCDEGVLVGTVPIERLMGAAAATPVESLIDRAVSSVTADASQESAALIAASAGRGSVAVVDDNGSFRGIIPPERLLRVLCAEHEEDMARLGGFLASTKRARLASEETVTRRLWHRLPWLALGLLGAMLSTVITASFESQIQAQVLLAFFVPAVVYMADAVGTQTEAVVIRGMSVGVPVARVVGREIATGLVVGAAIGVFFLAFALAAWGEPGVAVTVALALFVSSSAATVVAMTLPYLFARFGQDPAFGSGPLATVIQDLVSLAVYFGIAVALLT